MRELLTPDEMAEADRHAIESGPLSGYRLMLNAGAAVASEILTRYADARTVHVLCGPGNNGGDGYVVARLLYESGVCVLLWRAAEPRAGSDAARAADDCPIEAKPFDAFAPEKSSLVVDALFGAGLSRHIDGGYAAAIERTAEAGAKVLSIDLPSGVSGASGKMLGAAFSADLTVTFFRKRPGHLLYPGRYHCGETVVADIGIGDDVLDEIRPACFENDPACWSQRLPHPAADTHKYRRGHVAVFSGPASATGAARLAAQAAARAGAGAVTMLSPASAILVNAAHLTATMLVRADSLDDVKELAEARKPSAYVLGPGFGVGDKTRDFALGVLGLRGDARPAAFVLDADAITSFHDEPGPLFAAASEEQAPGLVLTPHEGEFARLFPDLAGDETLSKLERARQAAARASATIVFKGPDTVIAAPDGRAAINANGTPWLATAGSGDVLSGIIAGLAAQGMPAFEAACAAVWIHGEAGMTFGPGLIAEDLPDLLPEIFVRMFGEGSPNRRVP